MPSLRVWQGRSRFTGDGISAYLTWGSRNIKTGDIPQFTILLDEVSPWDAVKLGRDTSICGGCACSRSTDGARRRALQALQGVVQDPTCYVLPWQAAASIWAAQRDSTRVAPEREWCDRCAGHVVRGGAYGDPAAVPVGFWRRVRAMHPTRLLAYTHAWPLKRVQRYRDVCLASCTDRDRELAIRAGWKTYTVTREALPQQGACLCPADRQSPHYGAATCSTCGLCDAMLPSAHILTNPHGQQASSY
jgi:hypothetical protein